MAIESGKSIPQSRQRLAGVMETLGNTLQLYLSPLTSSRSGMNLDSTSEFFLNFQSTVSKPRLDRYRRDGSDEIDAVADYLWNVALSEALYPWLAMLEVSLRNALHRELSELTGTDMWFEQVLRPEQISGFYRLRNDLQKKLNLPPGPDKLVSELSFGFWVSLLTQPYNQRIWAPNKATVLKRTFPQMPRFPNARRVVHRRCNMIRILRNRVMHHEPILMGLRWNGDVLPLTTIHRQIYDVIHWINPLSTEVMAIT
ncbi:MAG: hypothetical protein WD401_04840, partial [Thermomicrobiaceae bacterium]